MSYVSHPSGMTPILRVTVAGSSRDFVDEIVTVGRDARVPISLPHPDVSRRHAEFRRTPEGWVLVDLGSTNGTLVGNRLVSQELIAPGQVLTVVVGGQGGPTFQVEALLVPTGGWNPPPAPSPPRLSHRLSQWGPGTSARCHPHKCRIPGSRSLTVASLRPTTLEPAPRSACGAPARRGTRQVRVQLLNPRPGIWPTATPSSRQARVAGP